MNRLSALIPTLLATLALAPSAHAAGFFHAAAVGACPDADPPGVTTAVDTTTVTSGWHASPYSITLSATGAAQMEWRLDCGTRTTAVPGDPIPVAVDGIHTFSHRAIDAGGQATAWVDDSVQIDGGAPTNTTSPATGWMKPGSVTVTATDALSGIGHVEWNLDGAGVQTGPSGSTVAIAADGTHTLETQAEDAVGNRSPLQTDTVRVDGQLPTDDTVVPTGPQNTVTTITVEGSDALSGVSHVEWKLDGGPTNFGAPDADVTIPEGTHSLETQVVDVAGNASGWAPHTVEVDLTGPADTTSVPSGWQKTAVTVNVTGTDTGSGVDHVEWKLDGVAGSGPNGSAVPINSDGVHTLETRIVDLAGEDSGWRTQTVRIDTVLPVDQTTAVAGWQTAPLPVALTGDDTLSGIQRVEWQIDGGAIQTSTSNPNTITVSANGVHTLNTQVVDQAGNASGWTAHTIKIDTTAPDNLTPVAASTWRSADYSVDVNGADSVSDLAEMHWRIDGGSEQRGPVGTRVAVTGTGTHTLTTWAVDRAGNASGPRDDTVRIDTLAPTDTTVPPTAPVPNHYPVSVTGTDAHSGVNHVEWRVDGGSVRSTSTATIDGAGDHVLETRVVDNAGNQASWTASTVTVDMSLSPDTTPPVDTTQTASAAWRTGQVTLTVSATDADTGVDVVQWRVDGGALGEGPSGSTVTIAGDGVHQLETHATDLAGNTSAWRSQTVKIDATQPVDSTSLPSGWSASRAFTPHGADATSGVAGIQYKIDGGAIQTVPDGGSVTVPADGPHTIAHLVLDAAGNGSGWKTDAVKVDTVKPVDTSPLPATGWITGPLGLTLTGTDALSGVDRYEWRVDGGDVQTGATPTVADGTHTLETHVVDAAGNASDWRTATVKVDRTAPVNSTPAPAAPWRRDAYTVTVAGTDAGGSGVDRIEWRVDGGSTLQTPTLTIASKGPHKLETRVVDLAGNASDWRTDSIGIDPDAPVVSADCGSQEWRAAAVVCNVAGDGGDSGLKSLTIARGSGTPQAVGTGSYRIEDDGEWALTLDAIDGAGNEKLASALVRVDRTPPTASVSCTPDKGTAYVCKASASDPTSGLLSIAYTVDGGAPQSLGADGSFTVGKGSVVVRATDRAGNVGASAPLPLANRVKPKPPETAPAPTPRTRTSAVLLDGGRSVKGRMLGELAVVALPSSTTVDLRPLALGKGRFRIELKVRADKQSKTVRKTVTASHGYTPRVTVKLGGAFRVSASLTVSRRSGSRWVKYAAGSATLR